MKSYDTTKPESGMKILIACDDGCSCSIAFVVDGDDEGGILILDAEDAYELDERYMRGALWTQLPADYLIAFMERD